MACLANQSNLGKTHLINLLNLIFLIYLLINLHMSQKQNFIGLMTNKITELNDEDIVNMFKILNSKMTDYGYQNYEISNWSKPGMESLHNMRYWKNDYIGFGPGASSFYGNNRKTNIKSLKNILILKNLILEFEENYTLNKKDNLIEIMLNLRLSSGINHEQFEEIQLISVISFFRQLISCLSIFNKN